MKCRWKERWSNGLRCVGWAAALALAALQVPAPRARAAEEEQSPPSTQPIITKVERYAADDTARIVLSVSQPLHFEARDASTTPQRLEVDLAEASYFGPHSFEMTGLVQRLRLLATGSRFRVALDTTAPARQNVFYLPDPFRVVIDVARGTIELTTRS